MNIKKLSLALGLSMSLVAGAAYASSGNGTVTFIGSIITAPCSIAPESVDQTVNLGQISNMALENGGKSTPQPFTIKLLGCDVSALTDKTVTTTFTGTASSVSTNRLAIVGTASGASVAITNNSAVDIPLGQPSSPTLIQNGNNILLFSAYLQGDGASATIVPGEFQAVANFTLDYQ